MIAAVLCTVLSAVGFYLSLHMGSVWPLAWIAPIPVLWLLFSESYSRAGLACWLAYALGSLNLLPVYAGMVPTPVLVLGIAGPGLLFSASARGARFVARRVSPIAGVLAFAALWTTCDFLVSMGRDGTAVSPAYSQVGAPFLIQGASIFGLWIVTFLLGFVSAGMAMSFATHRFLPAAIVLVVFTANLTFGLTRVARAPSTTPVRIGLGADDALVRAGARVDRAAAFTVVDAHVETVRSLAAQHAAVIVFPEKVAMLKSGWRDEAIQRLRDAARAAGVTIVIGFDDTEKERLNDALIFGPDGQAPAVYAKRHPVPVLEDMYVLGHSSFMLPSRIGVAICKDMDFQATLRRDAAAHPTILAVPAWDFDGDRWWHARLAIMRGVENGFAVARAAKDGLLTLSDAYGRIVARERSEPDRMVTLIGDLSPGPGDTIYRRIGDLFAWVSVALGALLIAFSIIRRQAGS